MANIIRDVSDLGDDERRALEHVLGQPLSDDQQVVIGLQPVHQPTNASQAVTSPSETIPAWWKVYEGLSDTEIDDLDAAIRHRADLTRPIA